MDKKLKVINPQIVVHGDAHNPYYEIEYYSIKDKKWHKGFGSYDLSTVQHWLKNSFEVVTADIAPIMYGEWIFGQTNGIRWMKCSKCNVAQLAGPLFAYFHCPNCGSEMNIRGYRKNINKIIDEINKGSSQKSKEGVKKLEEYFKDMKVEVQE